MAINTIPVDQRVIDIDSRRFASIEKALVELITNSDDSYTRLEREGVPVSGVIRIEYERHKGGAVLTVSDQAEGMAFEQARQILSYGGAHSPLSRGDGSGRGYFGRGLKQAIFGLGSGWLETINAGRLTRIELFRGDDGRYLYDDGNGDRDATSRDYNRLGIAHNGTRVAIVVDNPQVHLSLFSSVGHAVANNVYLRDVLARRQVDLAHLHQGREMERSTHIHFEEPVAALLTGPDQQGEFVFADRTYPFTLTLKRAVNAELTPRGDRRTNGLLVLSGMAVLDCQLFYHENQLGTEYLFGTVRCDALTEKLGQGVPVISDEREGLNLREPFVAAFAEAVSRMIAPFVQSEQEKLRQLQRATTSGRTTHMIEYLLDRMNRAAIHDLGIQPDSDAAHPATGDDPEHDTALRFSTPFYYRKPGHHFHVRLLIDTDRLPADAVLTMEYALPPSIQLEPPVAKTTVAELNGAQALEWDAVGYDSSERGEITVHTGDWWAWCEIVIAEHASGHHNVPRRHVLRRRTPRDHGEILFSGYELRRLDSELDRALYSPGERKIIINTGAPTVQLYIDGRGQFRDSARLLLAELFMDVISDELARHTLEKSGREGDAAAHHAVKLDIIRRYGSEIHLAFQNS